MFLPQLCFHSHYLSCKQVKADTIIPHFTGRENKVWSDLTQMIQHDIDGVRNISKSSASPSKAYFTIINKTYL